MKSQISNCCKEPVTVDTADEGTSCFMCSKCKKPCDLFLEETMKEQVSVDNDFVNKVIDIVGMGNIAWDNVHPIELCQAVIDTYKTTKEYERLKRLDDNVRKTIKMHQDHINVLESVYMGSTQECLACKDVVKLLESLEK